MLLSLERLPDCFRHRFAGLSNLLAGLFFVKVTARHLISILFCSQKVLLSQSSLLLMLWQRHASGAGT